ncbi:hypothetical protein PIB30_093855 [Stylosanthes scabra]|uniref:MADS-box domain-containing protein n=1 Tax=Stylosanthes scabra TaxID=79078 RepID=A0ABU6SVR8_9FABA|nr:hypothetical protein [Stylosanthes scabra]
MGRAKAELKCLSNLRERKGRFKTRIKGLENKLKKFSDTCEGSKACFIVYEEDSNAAPMIWPKDYAKVNSLIKKYEAHKNVKPHEIFDLEDFFKHKKTSIEAEISKARKCIRNFKYPTFDLNIQSLDLEQLRMFIGILDNKIGACDERIDLLKSNQKVESNFNFGHNSNQYNFLLDPILLELMGSNHETRQNSRLQLNQELDQDEDRNFQYQVGSPVHNSPPGNWMQLNSPVEQNSMQTMCHSPGPASRIMSPTTGSHSPEQNSMQTISGLASISQPQVSNTAKAETIGKDFGRSNPGEHMKEPVHYDNTNKKDEVSEALDWETQLAEAQAWASDFEEFENLMNQQNEHLDLLYSI